jgi:predicted dienelactone hydrolase
MWRRRQHDRERENTLTALTMKQKCVPLVATAALACGLAGGVAAADRAAPGPADVVNERAEWRDPSRQRNVPVNVFAPSAAVSRGELPLILVSPGFGESFSAYDYLARHLASHGYAVIVANHEGSDREAFDQDGWSAGAIPETAGERLADMSFVLDRVLADEHDIGLLRSRVDADRIGVAGHSAGSSTALALVGLKSRTRDGGVEQSRDPRVRAVLAMSPQIGSVGSDARGGRGDTGLYEDSWSGIHVPVLLMNGTRDYGVIGAVRDDPGARHLVFERLPGPDVWYLDIEGAEHHAFSASRPYYRAGARDPRHHGWIAATATAFFDAYLRGDGEALAWLDDGGPEQMAGGELRFEGRTAASPVRADRTAPAPAREDLTPVVESAERFARQAGVPGAALLILNAEGETILEHYIGRWDERTTAPIASASKWWAAATMMTLVDDGLVDLDDSVAAYLPVFRNRGAKSRITVRDTLRFTAGFDSHIAQQDDPAISQDDLVRHIAEDVRLLREPGTALHYGGLQMEIAGRIAEVVTGRPWAELFRERIVEPLELRDTRIANMRNRRPGDLVFDSANPLVPGGVVTSVRDYRHFLLMLLGDGVFRGTRVLSSEAVAEMLTDQTVDLPIAYSIAPDESYHYALGGWYHEDPENGATLVSSSGALGTTAWVDKARGYGAAFMTQARAGRASPFVWDFMDLVADVMHGAPAEAVDTRSPERPPPAGQGRPAPGGRGGGDWFERLDRDGNGVIERSEIPSRATRLLDVFDRLDRNRDGRLTPDEAPGQGAGAGPTAGVTAPRAAAPGARAASTAGSDVDEIARLVLHDDVRGRDIPVRLLFPPAIDGSQPLLLFSHYSGGTRLDYDPLVQHWARAGYVVALPDHSDSPEVGGSRGQAALADWEHRPRDISFLIDAAERGVLDAAAPSLAGHIDTTRIGVGGHALGAFTANVISGMAVESAPPLRDDRVDAVLLIAPQGVGQGVSESSWRTVRIPSMTIVGSEQPSRRTGKPARWRTASFDYAPGPDRYLLFVEGMGPGNAGTVDEARLPAADSTHTELLLKLTTAFWDAHLRGDADALALLTPAAAARIAGADVTFENH